MFRFFQRLVLHIVNFFRGTSPRANSFELKIFESRAAAAKAATKNSVAAMVCVEGNQKWILFSCPCGCNQQIALNLMKNYAPSWSVELNTRNSFSVHPSIDSESCGAHFWIKNGNVIWVD